MKQDIYGHIEISEDEAFDALYNRKITSLNSIFIDNPDIISQFNKAIDKNADNIAKLCSLSKIDLPISEFDILNQRDWKMPKDYFPNLIEHLYGLCKTKEQTDRVTQELELFIQYKMFDLLFFLKYLVDTMRNNNVVWGVGRGSSVASYILYLIGVHKIDSIKYNLDIKEFLK